ncbi:hypothetical protein Glove_328g103 [Diversispora epigaea]|uniref:DNA polymerase n=1 Tax=Diversispora epigaea TaxID=1348612 RepID=A0A397HKK5_9GLOM|nr:hypothetical protein Glove_328g103 [Diversispora epigaea]
MIAHDTQQIRYGGGEIVEEVQSRNDIATEFDNERTAVLQQSLSAKRSIHFMPTDVGDEAEYIKGVSTYILRISGALINGQKAIVDITGIKPFFDIEVPETTTYLSSVFKRRLINILTNTLKSTSKFGVETISAFPLRGYHTEKKSYIRVTTWNHFDRYNALKAVREVGIGTASDDLNPTYYYRKVALLSNYSYKYIGDPSLNIYSFRVSVNNYNPINDDDYNNPLISSALTRDRTLILTWDIETYSSLGQGNFPTAQSDESNVFMICMSVHWKDDPKPLKQICLVNVENAPDPRWTTIICESQTNLLKAFALCWKLLVPDIQIIPYDWGFIVKKAKKLGVLEWMFNQMSLKPLNLEKITKWQYQYNAIKTEKSSLAYYLKESKLDNKLDIPFHRMFKYYGRALKETNATTAEQMREVAEYCIIDAISCQRLMVKRNAINEYREVSSVAFIALYDSHYFAVGMKVRNLLSASAWQEGILTSTIPCEQTETGKYPGAYVFPPVKGLENRRPITGLDFASLYPSLIMTYNLSPDKIILSCEHAISVARSGKKLHKIEFEFNGRDIIAWSVKHENQSEMEGLYVIVLKELLMKRNKMKKCLTPLSEKKENMELILSNIGERTIPEAIEYILKNAEKDNCDKLTKKLHPFINKNNREFMVEYNSICFDHACLNAKQTALKVYMNTFYGEAENNGSPFFSLPLAGGVTSAGQRNIKLVADFVKNKGFKIKYGDTDSLYLVCPEEYFQECDTAYDNGNGISKKKYWNEMVKISMRAMGELRDKVNEFLKKDNGSTYLKMAYEEVLFPVVFIGKKKYYGIQHIKEPNFDPDPDKLFIRGVDIVKRGQSKLFRKIVKTSSQIDINECIRTYAWKPDKDNKSVKRFIFQIKSNHAREVKESNQFIKKGLAPVPYLYNIPEPGERFKCVVVEREDQYDEYGKKISGNDECFEAPTDDESLINITAPDKLWTKKDELEQKSAEGSATTHAEKIYPSISKADITRLSGASTRHNDYFNALDRIAGSTRSKLSDLLSKLSKLNVDYRNAIYELIVQAQKYKPDITILEEYIFRFNLESECEVLIDFRNTWYKVIGLLIARLQVLSSMQSSKKDDSSDIDEIIGLYC